MALFGAAFSRRALASKSISACRAGALRRHHPGGILFCCYLTTVAAAAATTRARHQSAFAAASSFSTLRVRAHHPDDDSKNNVFVMSATKPNPPLQRQITTDAPSLDLGDLSSQIVQAEERRQRAYDLSRQFQVALVKFKHHVSENGQQPNFEELSAKSLEDFEKSFVEKIPAFYQRQQDRQEGQQEEPSAVDHRTPRLANLSHRVEDYARCLAYHYFLKEGRLLPPSSCCPEIVTDEEYLAGACMGLAQDLQRYGLGRATARDAGSVKIACDLVSDLNDYLLGFDFRNGPLRRKYDGTKYTLKALETLLYELAVTGSGASTSEGDGDDSAQLPTSKRQRRHEPLIPLDELKALQERMVRRDELRETLIKKSRDGQKAAKQSIFALHRGDRDRASSLLDKCRECIVNDLLPIAREEPPLRSSGSLVGVMEEYVEAKLFATWLYGKDGSPPGAGSAAASNGDRPSGIVLKPTDFSFDGSATLEIDEYVGGLCDLTGEIGRYAVQRGTARDVDGVKLCLQTNSQIWYALQTMERLPGGAGKKMDTLQRSVEKLERMLYEMSLSEAAGGRKVRSEVEEHIMDVGDKD